MRQITRLARVMLPVSDQDAAIAFHTTTSVFSLVAVAAFDDGERWGRGRSPRVVARWWRWWRRSVDGDERPRRVSRSDANERQG